MVLGTLEESDQEDEGSSLGWYSLVGLDEDTLLGAWSLLWLHQVRDQAKMLGIISNSQPKSGTVH